jgi:hypothetical protein
MTPQKPAGFIIETEATKAAFQNGYQMAQGWTAGWGRFASPNAPGTIYLAAVTPNGPWLLSLDHPTAADALTLPPLTHPSPGVAAFSLPTLTALHQAISQTYDLSMALPYTPLAAFTAKTQHLPKTTEAERVVVQRIGQDLFRAALMSRWNARCPLTGITEPALLRASHIIPWSVCETDAERLNPDNGLLLSALWDAAFDKGLVSFSDEGMPIVSDHLGPAAQDQLNWTAPIPLTPSYSRNVCVDSCVRLKVL